MQVFKALVDNNVKIIPVVRTNKESTFYNHPNVVRIISSTNIFKENAEWWKEQCLGVDTVIHTAWYTEPGKYLQSSKNMDCLVGSLNLAQGSTFAGVKRFIGLGTCFEYELSALPLSIETPLNPHSPYASAKASLYIALSQWLKIRSVDFTWCRLFYLYGENEDYRRLVPYLHKQLSNGETAELTSGNQVRDYLDVVDAANIITNIALSDQNGPINVCSGEPITVRELAEQIADIYERRDLLNFGARPDNYTDPPFVVGVPNYD